jgi:hypothetical protein
LSPACTYIKARSPDRITLLHQEPRPGATAAKHLWAIYWRDRHLKFHEYKRKRPAKNVQVLLNHTETGGDPIFWA